MELGGTTISAQFLGNFSIISSDPLIGFFEFSTSTNTTIEVSMDWYSAEALLSALVQFLSHGQAVEFDDGM
ncbi:hypothetical protein [Ensifer sp.]|jgi:hypothetical protein|uniref:hypothetical protein n=1 Tax=Ensifer sp. TaxID=1872086 RepID=UPI002E12972A|nr:hypothetical protein [Ensifer sp.]